jgi:transketolase
MTVLFYDVLRLDPARPDWPGRDRFILSKATRSKATTVSWPI